MDNSAAHTRIQDGPFAHAFSCSTGKRALPAAHHSIHMVQLWVLMTSIAACSNMDFCYFLLLRWRNSGVGGHGVRVALSKPRAQRAISRPVASAVAQAPTAYRTPRVASTLIGDMPVIAHDDSRRPMRLVSAIILSRTRANVCIRCRPVFWRTKWSVTAGTRQPNIPHLPPPSAVRRLASWQTEDHDLTCPAAHARGVSSQH